MAEETDVQKSNTRLDFIRNKKNYEKIYIEL